MVRKKKQSKRMTLHKKYKIQKKVKEHKRNLNKEAKNSNKSKKGKKDPGIPNLWPFKEELLQQIETQKAKKEQEKREARLKQTEAKKRKRSEESRSQTQQLAQLQRDATGRAREFEKSTKRRRDDDTTAAAASSKDSSRRAYYRELRKVVEAADVILEVVDARDPAGCRCPDVEKMILKLDASKKIIIVLNKIDLVPREIVEKWLKKLRNEFPAIAFKSSTQTQRHNMGQSAVPAMAASKQLINSDTCLGADTLLQLLKNYCRNIKIKTSITVGIIGLPNVGKSSVINSLKRSKAVGVANTPGFTKAVQEIHLDKNIKLLDCPGIVFSSNEKDPSVILRNAVKVESLPDPIAPVQAIVGRCKAADLMQTYRIPAFRDVAEFLAHVARKRGKLKKGGIPDVNGAARCVLQDWNRGNIRFYTVPPEDAKDIHLDATVVSEWGAAFDVDAVFSKEQTTVLSSIADMASSDHHLMTVESAGHVKMDDSLMSSTDDADLALDSSSHPDEDEDEGSDDEDEDGEGDNMVDDDEDADADGDGRAAGTVGIAEAPSKKRKSATEGESSRLKVLEEVASSTLIRNQLSRKEQKKRKRDIRRGKIIVRTSAAPSKEPESDDYDFGAALAGALDGSDDGGGDDDDDDDIDDDDTPVSGALRDEDSSDDDD